jgi:hypothetical protein
MSISPTSPQTVRHRHASLRHRVSVAAHFRSARGSAKPHPAERRRQTSCLHQAGILSAREHLSALRALQDVIVPRVDRTSKPRGAESSPTKWARRVTPDSQSRRLSDRHGGLIGGVLLLKIYQKKSCNN